MFSKLLIILTLSLTSTVAWSQDAKTQEKKEEKVPTDLSNQNFAYTAFDYLKKKFTASYHGEYYFTRPNIYSANEDDHDISDMKIMHNPTIIYRPIENWRLLATSEFKYTDAQDDNFPNRHFRSFISLTREKILLEKEYGFGLSAGISRRIYDRVAVPTSYGNSRANVTLSKTWMEKHSSSLMIQYLANDPAKGKISSETWKHAINFLPTVTFQITDKIAWLFNDDFNIYTPWHGNTANSYTILHDMNIGYITYAWDDKNTSYYQQKYYHTDKFAQKRNNSDTFDYYIGHSYSFTPKFTVTAEVGSNMFASSDGRDFFSKNIEYPEFALYLDYAL